MICENWMMREIRETNQLKPLIEYIQRNLRKGYKLEDLKWALVNQGHSRVSIDKAITFINELQEAQKPKKQELPQPEVSFTEMPQVQEEKSFWGKMKGWFE